MKKILYLIICLLPALAVCERPGPGRQGALEIFGLMQARLGYMKDVAAFKHRRNLAVENQKREALVLDKAEQKAALLQLKTKGVRELFRAQIEAAKEIQRSHIKNWSKVPGEFTYKEKDLNTQVRPALIRLGDATLKKIQVFLQAGGSFEPALEADFIKLTKTEGLSLKSQKRIYAALRGLRIL